jgi:hypothetical protein
LKETHHHLGQDDRPATEAAVRLAFAHRGADNLSLSQNLDVTDPHTRVVQRGLRSLVQERQLQLRTDQYCALHQVLVACRQLLMDTHHETSVDDMMAKHHTMSRAALLNLMPANSIHSALANERNQNQNGLSLTESVAHGEDYYAGTAFEYVPPQPTEGAGRPLVVKQKLNPPSMCGACAADYAAAPFPHRPHFLCGGCLDVRYCCVMQQHRDRELHRPYCNSIIRARANPDDDHVRPYIAQNMKPNLSHPALPILWLPFTCRPCRQSLPPFIVTHNMAKQPAM